MTTFPRNNDQRHHLNSTLMGESLLDKTLQQSTESEVFRMLPDAQVIKIGGRSIVDAGRSVTYPVVEALAKTLKTQRLIIGTGGGARSRHVFSIGLDLGMPSGVLSELAQADALGNAHILGALLAPYGVVAIPPEIFGHLLPLFIRTAPGVIFTGVPPYSLWEHPPGIGRIPPHGSDAGCFLLAECFGCQNLTLVKDVDGLYDKDRKPIRRRTSFQKFRPPRSKSATSTPFPLNAFCLTFSTTRNSFTNSRSSTVEIPRRLSRL